MTRQRQALVQGPPEKPATAPDGKNGQDTPKNTLPACPECLQSFVPAQTSQLFCTPAHRNAWNNRAAVRARVLLPFAITARITREGTRGDRDTGREAANHRNTLIRRWVDEDKEAGRMPWPDYLRRRYAAGFDPL
jgi:hypothetical protein